MIIAQNRDALPEISANWQNSDLLNTAMPAEVGRRLNARHIGRDKTELRRRRQQVSRPRSPINHPLQPSSRVHPEQLHARS
jgi:hypothetical protein